MDPEGERSIVDMLDRCLNKGVILNADVIISVAGVPLVGLSLKAAVASIETMLDYGMMEAWDERTREWYAKEGMVESPPLLENESLLLRTFGSVWCSEGFMSAWKYGFWYLTSKRLFLWIKTGMMFETYLDRINGLILTKEIQLNKERDIIVMGLDHRKEARIHSPDVAGFKMAILKAMGLHKTKIAIFQTK